MAGRLGLFLVVIVYRVLSWLVLRAAFFRARIKPSHPLNLPFAPKPPGAALQLAGGLVWFRAGHGSPERARLPLILHIGQSEGLEMSAVLPRWGKTNVPARNKPSRPAIKPAAIKESAWRRRSYRNGTFRR